MLAEYLQDFARAQEDAGRIQYGTNVNEISRDAISGTFTSAHRQSAVAFWVFVLTELWLQGQGAPLRAG